MAKFKLNAAAPDDTWLPDLFPGGNPLSFGTHAGFSATLLPMEENGRIVLAGQDFSYSADDALTGTITKATIYDEFNNVTAKITKLDLDVVDLEIPTNGYTLFDLFLAGKDTVRGSNQDDRLFGGGGKDTLFGLMGDDRLSGGTGNDRYTGGKGSDIFEAGTVFGNDVVTDFDANGGGLDQDYIMPYGEFTIEKSGKDTLIEFEGNSSIRLLGVRVSDVTSEDFLTF